MSRASSVPTLTLTTVEFDCRCEVHRFVFTVSEGPARRIEIEVPYAGLGLQAAFAEAMSGLRALHPDLAAASEGSDAFDLL